MVRIALSSFALALTLSACGPAEEVAASKTINRAEAIWSSQLKAHATYDAIEKNEGAQAYLWLMMAEAGAGHPVRTGSVTVNPDGSVSYQPGGKTLRVNKGSFHGELQVDRLEGTLQTTGQEAGDVVDATWLLPGGKTARCIFEEGLTAFAGSFVDDEGHEVTVEVAKAMKSKTENGRDDEGNAILLNTGRNSISGSFAFESGVHVELNQVGVSRLCVTKGDACDSMGYLTSIKESEVTVTLNRNDTYTLTFTSGFVEATSSSARAKRWSGSIEGSAKGRLERERAGTGYLLNVVVGDDTHTADTAEAIAD